MEGKEKALPQCPLYTQSLWLISRIRTVYTKFLQRTVFIKIKTKEQAFYFVIQLHTKIVSAPQKW